MSSLSDAIERLKRDPDHQTLLIAGEEFPFLLTWRGVKIVERAHGGNPIDDLFGLIRRYGEVVDDADDDQSLASVVMENITSDDIDALVTVIWAGLIFFDEDITHEEVEAVVSIDMLMDNVEHVMGAANQLAEDVTDEDRAMAEESEDAGN